VQRAGAGPVVVPLVVPLVVALLAPLTLPRPAAATECQPISGGTEALAAIPAEKRLHWLDQRLASGAARARIWTWTWRAAYTGVTIAESVLAVVQEKPDDKAADIIGATSSAIGVIASFALPLKVLADQKWWSKHYATSHDDVCSLLNTAERLFIRGAESQEFGVGPLVHVGTFAINIAGGLILGLGWNRWANFAYSSLVGIGVGEIQIATQPTDLVEDLRLYRAGELSERPNPPRLGIALAPMPLRDGAGAAFTLTW
jgi:hypothetical protein